MSDDVAGGFLFHVIKCNKRNQLKVQWISWRQICRYEKQEFPPIERNRRLRVSEQWKMVQCISYYMRRSQNRAL